VSHGHFEDKESESTSLSNAPLFPEGSQASSVCPSREQFLDEQDYGALMEFLESALVFEGFQASPTCTSGKSSL
jgi:hypothetical protein